MTAKPNALHQLIAWLFTLMHLAIKCYYRGCEAYLAWSGEGSVGFINPERTQ